MFNPVKSIQTISEFTTSLKALIETSHPFVHLQGEVSNLSIPYSGHMYFILKDDKAQIRAVLFKGQRRYLRNDFKNGDKIICRGRVTVYEPRGDYQIIVDSVENAGYGTMQLQFEALKDTLEKEGLFAQIRKQKIPSFLQKICIITSPTGAAIHDFLEIALTKHPQLQIEIIATPMQGDQAPVQIKKAIETANKRAWADVIVLCRGGGSIEDLWAFNDENVARTIAHSSLPVVSAIGHEVDFTIADFVADLRSPTPTAAAEQIVPDFESLKNKINDLRYQLTFTIDAFLQSNQQNIDNHLKFLGDPSPLLEQQQLKIDYLVSQMELAFSRDIPLKKDRLASLIARLQQVSPKNTVTKQLVACEHLQSRLMTAQHSIIRSKTERLQRAGLMLDTLSPLSVLGRGYSITSHQNKQLITSIREVEIGGVIAIRLQDGVIKAKTTQISPKPK